jgi:hypothetical protein
VTNLHNIHPSVAAASTGTAGGSVPTAAGSLPTAAAHGKPNEREWTIAMIEASARSRSDTPEGRLLAVFEVLDELFNRADREARSFVEILADTSRGRPMGTAAADLIVSFRELTDRLAEEAELPDVESFGMSWRILSNGAILKAVDGDLESASRAREMAVDLIARHRPPTPPLPAGRSGAAFPSGALVDGVERPVALAQTYAIAFDVELELGFEPDGRYGVEAPRPGRGRHPLAAASTPFTDADYRVWELG